MNKEKLLALADVIEAVPPNRFDMCSSRMCLVEHAEKHGFFSWQYDRDADFGEAFDLSIETAHDIIYGGPIGKSPRPGWYSATPSSAAAMLRNLVETGEIDWFMSTQS